MASYDILQLTPPPQGLIAVFAPEDPEGDLETEPVAALALAAKGRDQRVLPLVLSADGGPPADLTFAENHPRFLGLCYRGELERFRSIIKAPKRPES